jgi:hypothetical protein
LVSVKEERKRKKEGQTGTGCRRRNGPEKRSGPPEGMAREGKGPGSCGLREKKEETRLAGKKRRRPEREKGPRGRGGFY